MSLARRKHSAPPRRPPGAVLRLGRQQLSGVLVQGYPVIGGLNCQLSVKLRGYPKVEPATERLGRNWLRHRFARSRKVVEDIGNQAFDTAKCLELILASSHDAMGTQGQWPRTLGPPATTAPSIGTAQPGKERLLLFVWTSTSPCSDRWRLWLPIWCHFWHRLTTATHDDAVSGSRTTPRLRRGRPEAPARFREHLHHVRRDGGEAGGWPSGTGSAPSTSASVPLMMRCTG